MRSLWLAVVALVVALAATVQLLRPVPDVQVRLLAPARFAVPGTPPTLPWPSSGQAAVAVDGVGDVGHSGPTAPQPIASLAKIMTALVVLQDHPLTPGTPAPTVTITPADVTLYQQERAEGQSVLPVAAGEVLDEHQLLEGLLIPSGNNIANLLARWDAGSVAAFVAKMNREAARLGMTATHYADASGVDPDTVSTAVDQLRVAEAAMAIPAFAEIVAMPQATLPVAGTVFNVNYFLGRGGIVGVKTGTTLESGGCYVAAAYRSVDGRRVLVLAAVLGQQGAQPLLSALRTGLALIDATGKALEAVSPVAAHAPVAELVAPWARPVLLTSPSGTTLVGWPGLQGRVTLQPAPLGHQVAAGARVATLDVALGQQRVRLPLTAPAAVPPPPLWWRLLRR